jgi:hypothetical protein
MLPRAQPRKGDSLSSVPPFLPSRLPLFRVASCNYYSMCRILHSMVLMVWRKRSLQERNTSTAELSNLSYRFGRASAGLSAPPVCWQPNPAKQARVRVGRCSGQSKANQAPAAAGGGADASERAQLVDASMIPSHVMLRLRIRLRVRPSACRRFQAQQATAPRRSAQLLVYYCIATKL